METVIATLTQKVIELDQQRYDHYNQAVEQYKLYCKDETRGVEHHTTLLRLHDAETEACRQYEIALEAIARAQKAMEAVNQE